MPIWWVAGPASFNWYAVFVSGLIAYGLYGPGCDACIIRYNNPGNF